MPRELPPPLELACLRTLWSMGSGNVHQVRESLHPKRLAYTTVMTLLGRLEKRGLLERRKSGRAFVYAPVIEAEKLRNCAVDELLENFFEGSREKLADWLESGPAMPPRPQPGGLDPTLL